MEIGDPLELWWETRGSARVVAVHSEVLSRCSVGLSVPFELWQGTRGSSQVVKGISVFLSSCNRGVRPPLKFVGNSGFFSICIMGVGPHLELSWGTRVSSQVAGGDSELLSSFSGNSVFLSSYSVGFRVPLEPWRGTRGSS